MIDLRLTRSKAPHRHACESIESCSRVRSRTVGDPVTEIAAEQIPHIVRRCAVETGLMMPVLEPQHGVMGEYRPASTLEHLQLGSLDIDLDECWGVFARQHVIETAGLNVDVADLVLIDETPVVQSQRPSESTT